MKKERRIDLNFDYKNYWEYRYANGNSSGSGSYGENAEFKAKVIDRIIKENNIKKLVDFGCGDGNQISLIKSDVFYTGYDISKTAISLCEEKFKGDEKKRFILYDPLTFKPKPVYEMSMSLDMLFHVTKEEDWLYTINCICSSSNDVILIITNTEEIKNEYFPHVNFKRKILPILDNRKDVTIEEVITQPTHKESNVIILRKEKRLA